MSLIDFLAYNVIEDVAGDIEREEQKESDSYETGNDVYDKEDESSDDDNEY